MPKVWTSHEIRLLSVGLSIHSAGAGAGWWSQPLETFVIPWLGMRHGLLPEN